MIEIVSNLTSGFTNTNRGPAAQLSGQLTQAALEHTRLQSAFQVAQGNAASARSDAERLGFESAEFSADLESMKGKYEDIPGELASTQIALAVQLREGELSGARLVASDSKAHAHGQEKQALLHQRVVRETKLRQVREMAMQQK